jgi:hypothetical protein
VCGPEYCELWRDENFYGLALSPDDPPTRLILVTVGSTDVLIAWRGTGALLVAEAEAVLASVDFD